MVLVMWMDEHPRTSIGSRRGGGPTFGRRGWLELPETCLQAALQPTIADTHHTFCGREDRP